MIDQIDNTNSPLQMLSPKDLSQRWGVCLATVYNLMNSGELPSVKFGRARRVPLDAVTAYIQQQAGTSGGQPQDQAA